MINPGGGNENEPRSSFPGPNAQRNNPQYKFTQEEVRVIKECNRDSFYQRCLPLSALLAGGTYYAIKTGFLKPSPKLGPTPKVFVSIVVGYFIGKFSYQSKCAEKLMQLPNSQIGEMLRQRRRGNLQESMDSGFGPGMSLAPFSGINPTDTYSDLNPNSSLNLDTSRPDAPGLDEYSRPSMDNPIYEEEMPPVQKTATSYEELRKRNREDYQQKRLGNYREPVRSSPSTPSSSQPQSSPESETEYALSAPKNKYGDSMN